MIHGVPTQKLTFSKDLVMDGCKPDSSGYLRPRPLRFGSTAKVVSKVQAYVLLNLRVPSPLHSTSDS